MKKTKFEKLLLFARRITLIQALFFLLITYLLFITFGTPVLFKSRFVRHEPQIEIPRERIRRRALNINVVSGLIFDEKTFKDKMRRNEFSLLHKSAKKAWLIGKGLLEDIQSGKIKSGTDKESINATENVCPYSISLSGMKFKDGPTVIPCGLIVGSHVTLVGRPAWAHLEHDEDQDDEEQEEDLVLVSQFRIELQGLKTVDGEDPPRILHFNPRLKGDWSGMPVIEANTCYRMQWGWPHRCEGFESKADEETVDGHKKCEKWIREDEEDQSEESKNTWWLNRLTGKPKKRKQPVVNWPFPFTENKIFILTLSAGLEGYHISVDGRHVTSFPYRTGFALEDATGLSVSGDVDVHFVLVGSLPATHPSFAPQRHLEMLDMWRAPPLPNRTVELFIGVISAGNHFAERMAVRKSWMQHNLIRSSNVVARFFLALHGRMEINLELKKEAEYFGDIVIVPYIDNYDLVVLKTVAICEFGVRSLAAHYLMKCDDDTFVRPDAVINEARSVDQGNSFYLGNMNYNHKPMRNGKWAVAYEEWPEEGYPPYANGPGYILSFDIGQFIVSEFEKHKLRLFKMEDVSMGIWVELFNDTNPVEYIHDERFCQFGCIEDYLTAHYQSPKQMICMWDKLQNRGKAQCCDMR